VNQEANVVINDNAFARSLREQIQRGVADGVEVLADEFAHTPWHRRLRHMTAFFLYRMAIRVITFGKDA
jgi:cardiolipin synthase